MRAGWDPDHSARKRLGDVNAGLAAVENFSGGGGGGSRRGGGASPVARIADDASKAATALDDLRQRLARVLEQLDPALGQTRRRADMIGTLQDGLRAGLLPRAEGLRRLGEAMFGDLKTEIVTIPEELQKAAERTKVQTVAIAETFQQMTDRALGALRRLTDGIRGGDFLSILEGVLGIFTTLGGAGLFGGKIQKSLQSTPGFARGGAMQLGGFAGIDTNVLSLNGSPIARVSRGETMQITPANDRGAGSGGTTIIHQHYTLPSDEFWRRVDGRAAGVVAQSAPAIAQAGSSMAIDRIRNAQQRSLR